jgi:hypothetical protein
MQHIRVRRWGMGGGDRIKAQKKRGRRRGGAKEVVVFSSQRTNTAAYIWGRRGAQQGKRKREKSDTTGVEHRLACADQRHNKSGHHHHSDCLDGPFEATQRLELPRRKFSTHSYVLFCLRLVFCHAVCLLLLLDGEGSSSGVPALASTLGFCGRHFLCVCVGVYLLEDVSGALPVEQCCL